MASTARPAWYFAKRPQTAYSGWVALLIVFAATTQAGAARGASPELAQVPLPASPPEVAAPARQSPAAIPVATEPQVAPPAPPAQPAIQPPPPAASPPTKPEPAVPEPRRLHRGSISLLFGMGMGFFDPQGVNQHMRDWVSKQPGYVSSQQGFTEMYLNFFATAGLQWHLVEAFTIEALGELGLAPKWIVIANGDSNLFVFWRVSGGILAKLNLVVNRSATSVGALTLAAGPLLHYMRFDGYSATSPGVRVQIGYVIGMTSRVRPEGFVAFDWARANGENGTDSIPLSYTGVILGGKLGIDL